MNSLRLLLPLLILCLIAPVAAKSTVEGQRAPAFAGLGLDGNSYRLADYSGKVVLINFWASWCGPCRQEMPPLNEMYMQHNGRGLVVLGVNVDETLEEGQRLVKKLKVNYPNVFDHDKNISKGYRVKAMPMTVIVDRRGVIRHVHYGFKSGYLKKYRQEVQKLLAEGV